MRTQSALIIGKDGLVGSGVFRLFRAKGVNAYGTTRRRPLHDSDILLDLSDRDLAKAELPQTDVAIICAAANGFAYCRSNPENAKQVNVDGPLILARKLSSRGTRVIYLSSSAVFDFSRPHVTTPTPHCPSTIYGKSKAAGEQSVLSVGQFATIVRLTKVLTPDMALLRQWIDTLHAGKNVGAFSDLNFCPISLDYVANALLAITEAGLPGIFHVSGASDISYFDAARHFAERMGVDGARIIEDRAAARGIPREEIATFTSLDASRYSALTGELPPQPLDVLDAIYGAAIADAMAAQ
jgi:dTDP-4-dehydrorhamnose reductase